MTTQSIISALDRTATVYVAGHRGLVGSALCRALASDGFTSVVGLSSSSLDLRDRAAVWSFFDDTRPSAVVMAAGRVGGIAANSTYPVDFLSDNLLMEVNVLDAAVAYEVPRLLFLGSSCIYPKYAPQPIREDALLSGGLEPTNDAYAVAKIAGVTLIQAVRRQYGLPWISAMPTNLYGPGDNFSPTTSHVLPALIRRYDEAADSGAPVVTNWGSGTPRREFLHVDDLAEACLFLLDNYDDPRPINVGTGEDLALTEVATLVAELAGYHGETRWDTSHPDGTPRKVLDVSRINAAGWSARTPLGRGIAETVAWYRLHRSDLRA